MSENLETKLPPQAHAYARTMRRRTKDEPWQDIGPGGPADAQVLPRGEAGWHYMAQVTWDGLDAPHVVVRHAGAVLPWKSDDPKTTDVVEADWTPKEKSAKLKSAELSMYGRAYFGVRPGMDTASKRARNDEEQAAGITPVSMFNPSFRSGEKLSLVNGNLVWTNAVGSLIGTLTPVQFADLAHATAASNAIIALGNEIGVGWYWPADYRSAVVFFHAVAVRLRQLGRKDIAAPCRSNPDMLTAANDWLIVHELDHDVKAFGWLNVHFYSDGTAGFIERAKSATTTLRKICDDNGRKLLIDEWGCLDQAMHTSDKGAANFAAIADIVVPNADVSCAWVLAQSGPDPAAWSSVYLVNQDGSASIYLPALRKAAG